jgi:hypothetical protein
VLPKLAALLAFAGFAALAAAGFFLGMPSWSTLCELRPQRKTASETTQREAATMKMAVSQGGMMPESAADARSLAIADGYSD